MSAAVPGTLTFNRDPARAAQAAIRRLGEWELIVGLVGPGSLEIEEGSALTLAQLGAIHEFGSDAEPGEPGYVPERSYLRSTLANRRADIARLTAEQMRAVLAGKRTAEQALEAIGMQIVAWIKLAVMSGDGIPPPLSPETVARKGSSRPLVDHGQLIAHGVNYVVRRKGSG